MSPVMIEAFTCRVDGPALDCRGAVFDHKTACSAMSKCCEYPVRSKWNTR